MGDRDGNPVHAVFGFARFLGDLIERVRPRYIASPSTSALRTSYRNRIYPAYKANREPAPADLALQFERCRELCRHLGLAYVRRPGVRGRRHHRHPRLPDARRRHALGLHHARQGSGAARARRRSVLGFRRARAVRLPRHRAHFGVRTRSASPTTSRSPATTSDNIPGVPGIGPKIAATLMRQIRFAR